MPSESRGVVCSTGTCIHQDSKVGRTDELDFELSSGTV
jgi:hypothetical protein